MNAHLAAAYAVLLFVAAAASHVGMSWDGGHGRPECPGAPLNATFARCSPFTAAARHLVVGVVFGFLPTLILVLSTDTPKPRSRFAFKGGKP